jgi:hypothetical protein
MQKQNILNSPRLLELKRRRRKAILYKFLLYFFGVVVVFILLGFLSCIKNLNISDVEISGNSVLETEALQNVVKEQIAGKYLWLFPKTNILFYPQNKIKNELQNKFKRIKDITLSIKKNNTLEVSLTERTAAYTWCGATLPLLRGGVGEGFEQCYFMDRGGYIFDEAPFFSGEVYFKFYGSADGQGSYFLKKDFERLIYVKDILLSLNLKPVAVYVARAGDVEFFLSKGTASASTIGPKIIFKLEADFQNATENLQAALNTEPLKSKIINKYSSLQYIDLRFGNKVYDKFN